MYKDGDVDYKYRDGLKLPTDLEEFGEKLVNRRWGN